MAGLLQQFGLGLKGVNRVSNPVDMQEGQLRLAQNASVSTKYGRAALLKRRGVGMLVDTTLSSGSLLAIMPLPFADPTPGSLIVSGYPPWPIFLPPPAAPAASTASATSITWTWDAVPGATGYVVDVSDDGFVTFVEQDVPETDPTHTATGLSPETTYQIRVRTENDRGEGENSEPGEGTTDEAPPPPASGTWEIPLESLTGFAADLFQNGPAGSKEPITGVDEWTYATFDALQIMLNGGAAQPVSGLPAGFTVTLARIFWGGWIDPDDLGTLPGPCGVVTIWDGAVMKDMKLTTGNYLSPMYFTTLLSGPPLLSALLGMTIEAQQARTYGNPYYFNAYGWLGGAPRLYGNYSIV